MLRKQSEDVYVVIEKLKKAIQDKSSTIQTLSTLNDSLLHQLKITKQQLSDAQKKIHHLQSSSPPILSSPIPLQPPILSILPISSEYTPPPITLLRSTPLSSSMQLKEKLSYGEYLIEDFLLVGPTINSFKELKLNHNTNRMIVHPELLFNHNQSYCTFKKEILNQITTRAFSKNITANKLPPENYSELRRKLERESERGLNQKFFCFTLLQDAEVSTKEGILTACNPKRYRFVFCLKVQDFIAVRDDKYYQKKQKDVWQVQKVFAIVTYYPFFDLFASVLGQIHACQRRNLIERVIMSKQDLLLWHLPKKTHTTQKNQRINDIIKLLISTKPQPNLIISYKEQFFSTLPDYGFNLQYSLALNLAPLFFSTFAYQQLLFLLTALLCQKSLVFISKQQSHSSLCALFLLSILSPFCYSSQVLLNCAQMTQNMVFECPFPLVASMKCSQIDAILPRFMSHNERCEQEKQMLLIDVDTNSIFYDPSIEVYLEAMVHPLDEEFAQAYSQCNPAQSKSFSFPKRLSAERVKADKNDEKKIKELVKVVEHNQVRNVTFKTSALTHALVYKLTLYIRSFAIEKHMHRELLQNQEKRGETVANYLKKKHLAKDKFIQVFINTQMYVDYMDSLL